MARAGAVHRPPARAWPRSARRALPWCLAAKPRVAKGIRPTGSPASRAVSLGTGCRRGLPRFARGNSRFTPVVKTFSVRGTPTAQVQAACAQPLAEWAATDPVSGIRQHAPEAQSTRDHPVDLSQRDLRLGYVRYAPLPAPLPWRSAPDHRSRRGQEQPQADRHRHLAPRQGQRHQGLAVRLFAERPAVLRRHTNRGGAFLRQRGIVDDQHCIRTANLPIRPLAQHPPEWRIIPGRDC